jgi:putative FmdB family regulatory protein
MPLYLYKCKACNKIIEAIRRSSEANVETPCEICGEGTLELTVSQNTFDFSSKADKSKTAVTPKEIDQVVGAEAEKTWAGYNEKWKNQYKQKRDARRSGKTLVEVDIPRDADGKVTPMMHLGDKQERSLRKDFVESLKSHREERSRKGLEQFDGKGSF